MNWTDKWYEELCDRLEKGTTDRNKELAEAERLLEVWLFEKEITKTKYDNFTKQIQKLK
jgi:hypothetical protein